MSTGLPEAKNSYPGPFSRCHYHHSPLPDYYRLHRCFQCYPLPLFSCLIRIISSPYHLYLYQAYPWAAHPLGSVASRKMGSPNQRLCHLLRRLHHYIFAIPRDSARHGAEYELRRPRVWRCIVLCADRLVLEGE